MRAATAELWEVHFLENAGINPAFLGHLGYLSESVARPWIYNHGGRDIKTGLNFTLGPFGGRQSSVGICVHPQVLRWFPTTS